jgi:lysozyme
MTHSQAAIDLIKEFEGCRLEAYQDQTGVWTIGYGHTLGVLDSSLISERQALLFLGFDLDKADAAVNKLAPWANQNQFDALVDFAFNLGTGALATMLHHGQDQVPTQILAWVYAGHEKSEGLVRRRAAEKAVFEEAV